MTTPLDEASVLAAVGLASLGVSPGRLRRLVGGRGPQAAWELLRSGTHPDDPGGVAAEAARRCDVTAALARCAAQNVRVLALGGGGYPASLAGDDQAPAVLFATGDPAVLDRARRVAVVGTRSATSSGREVAFAIGSDLARAGCVVVSGLALGIDASAHQGALAAGGAAVAVLGTSHDAPSSPLQRRLRDEVASTGSVLAELPPGAPVARWRFAVRNRIMAALAELVVVVECHADGGAMHTVRAARRRGVTVAVVPGSVRSVASAGTNQLLVSGAPAVRNGADILTLLCAAAPAGSPRLPGLDEGSGRPVKGALPPAVASVLAALEDQPRDLESVVGASGLSLLTVTSALDRLAEAGLATSEAGWWRRRRAEDAHR